MDINKFREKGGLQLSYLLDFYTDFPKDQTFFNNYFNNLAGTSTLKQQIKDGMTEAEIRESWAEGLSEFKAIRSGYLMYVDFE